MARNMMFYKVSLLILGVVLMACLVNADYSSEIEDDGYDSDVSSEGDSEGKFLNISKRNVWMLKLD